MKSGTRRTPSTKAPSPSLGNLRKVRSLVAGESNVEEASYVSLHLTYLGDLVRLINEGISWTYVGRLAADMGVPRAQVTNMLVPDRMRGKRRPSARARLTPREGELVLGLARLIGQVQHIVDSQGDDAAKAFNAAHWVAQWIEEPLPALGGALPASYLNTTTGQQLVSALVTQMVSGAYA